MYMRQRAGKVHITADTMADIHMLASIYPIVESILSNLSATDTSAFAYSIGMEFSDAQKKKYMSVLRDIPEHCGWIEQMQSMGNEVTLVGKDLERIQWRIDNPGKYDRRGEVPICIWLAVVDMEHTRANRVEGSSTRYLMSFSGNMSIATGYYGALLGSGGHYSTMFILRYGHTERLPGSLDWHVSTIPNANNIKVVYFASGHNALGNTDAYVSPTTGHGGLRVVRARECFEAVVGRCPEGPPGWNVPLIKEGRDSQGPPKYTLPYLRLDAKDRIRTTADHQMSSYYERWMHSNFITMSLWSPFPHDYADADLMRFTIVIGNAVR